MAGTSLVVQRLRLHASTAGGTGSISGRGTKIPQATWCGQKQKQKNKQTKKNMGEEFHIVWLFKER